MKKSTPIAGPIWISTDVDRPSPNHFQPLLFINRSESVERIVVAIDCGIPELLKYTASTLRRKCVITLKKGSSGREVIGFNANWLISGNVKPGKQ